MEKLEVLKEIGLSEGEARIYLTLLRLGEAQVNRIKIETKMHRTTIYDFLDGLAKKGLVSSVIKNSVRHYRAVHPTRLESLVKDKQEHLNEILPRLLQLADAEKHQLKIEVYDGVEGFKTWVAKQLKERADLIAFGIEEGRFEERFPHIIKSYLKKEQKLGLRERLIARKGATFVYPYPHMQYRYIDDKFFGPTPTIIFGNNVGIIIWEPLTMIMIENKDLADAYRRHFELLWKIADRKP